MSLGHVYIVLEPVGSARLTLDDDRYYEFMCFYVPKVVHSPGCDHVYDEESRNGQDIKIDILEGYVWTPERFRMSSGIFRSTGRLPEPPEELMGLNGPYGKEIGEVGRPPRPSTNWTRGKGCAPSFLLNLFLFLLLLLQLGKGGNLLLLGVGIPPWARPLRPALLLLPSFIYGGGGTP